MQGNFYMLLLVFLPILAALLCYLSGIKSRKICNIIGFIAAIAELLLSTFLFLHIIPQHGDSLRIHFFHNFGLFFKLDGFRVLYICIASFLWMSSQLFSVEYLKKYNNINKYYLYKLLTLGATAGVFLSADFFTVFIFFELVSYSSHALVGYGGSENTLQAADIYHGMTVIAGFFLMLGMFLLYREIGTLEFEKIYQLTYGYTDHSSLYPAGICLLIAFGSKAGMFPFHVWLPKAHPVAPAPASGLMSGILTKTGVFGLLVISIDIFTYDRLWGFLIIALGAVTMFVGAAIALFSTNFKHTLACSSVSQIGIIIMGISMIVLLGDGHTIAVEGTLLHMINHSLFKFVLFTVAGVISIHTHQVDFNRIRGFGRGRPLLMLSFLFGAFGMAGIPLWSGYISKTLIHEAILEYISLNSVGASFFVFLEWLFIISGGLTIAYMIKLFVVIFVDKDRSGNSMPKKYISKLSGAVLLITASIILVLGVFPEFTMMEMAQICSSFARIDIIPREMHYATWHCLQPVFISSVIGTAVYFLFVRTFTMKKGENGERIYINRWPEKLNLEHLVFRHVLKHPISVTHFLHGKLNKFIDSGVSALTKPITRSGRQLKELEHALVRIFFLLLIFISFVLFLMIIF